VQFAQLIRSLITGHYVTQSLLSYLNRSAFAGLDRRFSSPCLSLATRRGPRANSWYLPADVRATAALPVLVHAQVVNRGDAGQAGGGGQAGPESRSSLHGRESIYAQSSRLRALEPDSISLSTDSGMKRVSQLTLPIGVLVQLPQTLGVHKPIEQGRCVILVQAYAVWYKTQLRCSQA